LGGSRRSSICCEGMTAGIWGGGWRGGQQGPALSCIEYDAFLGCSGVRYKFSRVPGMATKKEVGAASQVGHVRERNITEWKKQRVPIVQAQATHKPVGPKRRLLSGVSKRERPCTPGNWDILDPHLPGTSAELIHPMRHKDNELYSTTPIIYPSRADKPTRYCEVKILQAFATLFGPGAILTLVRLVRESSRCARGAISTMSFFLLHLLVLILYHHGLNKAPSHTLKPS